MGVVIEVYVGNDSAQYIELVSKLRIEAFKGFPYLYQGDLDYEKQYVSGYTTDKKAMIALAKIGEDIVGVSTGIPLISDSEIVADAKVCFSRDSIDINDYYYYGEVIVLPEHQGKGIASKLYAAQDEIIKSWGYRHVCILTVVRESDHPLRPIDYKSPDKMWEHLGFFRNKQTIGYHWPTIQADGSVKDVNNTLEFWTKNLNQALVESKVLNITSDEANLTEYKLAK